MEYLITNTMTGAKTWVSAYNMGDALRGHEQDRRTASGEVALSPTSKIGHDNGDNTAHSWLGDSAIRGTWSAVRRITA